MAGLEFEVDCEGFNDVGVVEIVRVAVMRNEESANGVCGFVCPITVDECECAYALSP